jgi:hypothetical protein
MAEPTQTLTIRSPEDLLAAAPVVLGFVPSDSAVMFTFDAVSCFHARVDLPARDDDVEGFVDALLTPCLRHDVRRVFFLLYSDDPVSADRVASWLVRAFRAADIDVIDVVRADGRRWFPMLGSRRSALGAGVPYDVSAHRFAAESVLRGQVTHASRADLEATVAPDPAAVSRVAAAARDPAPAEPGWPEATVVRHVAADSVPDDAEAATLLALLGDLRVRDAMLGLLCRQNAKDHARLWADLVRRAPDDVVAPAAAVLAFAAWMSGDGALAWCAVDRSRAAEPDHRLAHRVAQALTRAVPPSMWEGVTATADPS